MLLRLPNLISTAHLVDALPDPGRAGDAARRAPSAAPARLAPSPRMSRLIRAGLAALLVQLALGGYVRHSGAGLGCPELPALQRRRSSPSTGSPRPLGAPLARRDPARAVPPSRAWPRRGTALARAATLLAVLAVLQVCLGHRRRPAAASIRPSRAAPRGGRLRALGRRSSGSALRGGRAGASLLRRGEPPRAETSARESPCLRGSAAAAPRAASRLRRPCRRGRRLRGAVEVRHRAARPRLGRRGLHAGARRSAPTSRGRHGLLVLVGVMLLSCGASALNQVQERRQRRAAWRERSAGRCRPAGSRSRRARSSRCSGSPSGAARALARRRADRRRPRPDRRGLLQRRLHAVAQAHLAVRRGARARSRARCRRSSAGSPAAAPRPTPAR